MRVEPYVAGSILHAIKRGSRGLPIVRDDIDRRRFVQLLYYANDTYQDDSWENSIKDVGFLERPEAWPERRQLVDILAWTLMSNHFHLVLKARHDGSVSKFMQRLCGSMTMHFNAKYSEQGTLFQGAYRSRTAELHGDEYLRLLAVYVMVKNTFELYSGGFHHALKQFDAAYDWAIQYPYSSLSMYAGVSSLTDKIVDKDIFGEMFPAASGFKEWAHECLEYNLEQIESMNQKQV